MPGLFFWYDPLHRVPMNIDLPIECDFPCVECGYNLRTRRVNEVCPECGTPVLKSVKERGAWYEELDEINERLCYGIFDAIPAWEAYSSEAMIFVMDAIPQQKVGKFKRSYNAAQVCDAFRASAQDRFGSEAEAAKILKQWGIRSSEDVGRIFFMLINSAFLDVAADCTIEQFKGIFDFGD